MKTCTESFLAPSESVKADVPPVRYRSDVMLFSRHKGPVQVHSQNSGQHYKEQCIGDRSYSQVRPCSSSSLLQISVLLLTSITARETKSGTEREHVGGVRGCRTAQKLSNYNSKGQTGLSPAAARPCHGVLR